MSTSANVIEYQIKKDGKNVGHYRQNILCKTHFENLLKFEPLNEHTITPSGYDEEDEYWEDETVNLEVFLSSLIKWNKLIGEYFDNK